VDRIDFFLDNRSTGGRFVGTATPGPTPAFQTTLSLPNQIGGHTLFVYARSAVTAQESVVSIPIAIGENPSKAFVVIPTSQSVTCTP
jgi:hypothetical protein